MVKFKKVKKKNITINNNLYSTTNSLDSVRSSNDDTIAKTIKEESRAVKVSSPDRDLVPGHEIVNPNSVVNNSNNDNNTNDTQIKEENDDTQRETKRNIINNDINDDNSNDNNEDTEEGQSYYNTIQSFQKKQRLKQQIRSHKKYITPQSQQQTTAKKSSNILVDKEKVIQEANRDLKDRLEGTFSSSLSSSSKNKMKINPLGDHDDDDDDEDEDGGILRQKHKLAMEQFIQSEMQTILQSKAAPEAGLNKNPNNNNNATVDNNGIDNSININTKLQNENDLYIQLLSNATNIQSSLQEGDVGAGGAILGGTGIAEVVLPVEERIQTVKETEMAALQKGLLFRTNKHYKPTLYNGNAHTSNQTHDEDDLKHLLPMNFGQGPGKKRQRPSSSASTTRTSLETFGNDSNVLTTPTTTSFTGSNILSSHHQDMSSSVLASSYSHNFRLHNSEWIANKKRDQEKEEEMEAMKKKRMDVDQVYDSNRTRVGFDGRKNKDSSSVIGGGSSKNDYTPNASSGNSHGNRSRGNNNDDRLWKSFVTKQRERGGRG